MDNLQQVTWLGHASFCFIDELTGNRIYYADPFSLTQQQLPKADLLFITHAHPDHLSQDDIKKVTKEDTIIIAPQNCLDKIQWEKLLPQAVSPNNSYLINDFSFSTIPAYNIKPDRLQFHPIDNHWVGYIFNLNGKKIYHAGDTDFIPEMRELANEHLDVALLPIGGTYTMDVAEAIEAANVIQAAYTVPMHYKRLLGDKATITEELFKKGVTKSQVRILQELA